MQNDEKVFISRAMADLILPTFQLINDTLLLRNLTPEWIREPERHEIKFTGPNGEACKFSASAGTRRRTPEDTEPFPAVVFQYRRGILNVTNNVGEPVDEYTPALVLAAFKMIFIPWFI